MKKSISLGTVADLLACECLPAWRGVVLSEPTISSQRVTPGALFIAVPGTKVDGHQFLDAAFSAGAAAAVVTDSTALKGRPGIAVKDAREAVGLIGALFADFPTREMITVGVTGTNGKTTIHSMTFDLANMLGLPAMRVGTIGLAYPGHQEEGALTTPDAIDLQRWFRSGRNAGAQLAVMEASSHALDQKRVAAVEFDVGVFTNLTRDHLDYHGTMERYFEAKSLLFNLVAQSCKKTKAAVINIDDQYGARYYTHAQALGLRTFGYGRAEGAEVRIEGFSQSIAGSRVTVRYAGHAHTIATPCIGQHNAYNMAAVIGTFIALGYSMEQIVEHIGVIPPVCGRLEPVGNERLGVYVDYAHTPDALENVLRAVREVTSGRVWVVFGCGGDRDRGKRPMMAQIAAQLADVVVVTSDNPRTEAPEAIIADILSGGVMPKYSIVDRREAIRTALSAASDGDVVLIAGKGHEDYQIIGTTKFHFSDQEEVRAVLGSRDSVPSGQAP